MSTTSPPVQAPTTTMTPTVGRAVAAAAGPALIALAGIISPINDSDEPADRLADIFAHEARYNVTLVCLVAGLLLLVPAVFWLRDAVPAPGRRAATVGATLAAAGFMLFVVASGALGFAPAAWATLPDAQRQELLPAFTAIDDGKGALGPVLAGPLLPVLGLAILAATLWRHTTHPRLALVALPMGWAVFLFAPVGAVDSIGALLLLGGLVTVLRPRNRPEPGHTH